MAAPLFSYLPARSHFPPVPICPICHTLSHLSHLSHFVPLVPLCPTLSHLSHLSHFVPLVPPVGHGTKWDNFRFYIKVAVFAIFRYQPIVTL